MAIRIHWLWVVLFAAMLAGAMSVIAPAPPAAAAPTPTDPNLKVAFIGDSGYTSGFKAVLNTIKNESADLVIHNGDMGYSGSPAQWEDALNSVLGSSFPYVYSVGNHDIEDNKWPDYQQRLRNRIGRVSGMSCTGDLGVNSWCTYRGLWFLLSGVGTLGSGHASYLKDNCTAADNVWKVVGWHKNQKAMQVGGKSDETGWPVYEESRRCGAIISTAHEHSYARTRTLTSTESQTVDSSCGDANKLCVNPGRSFVFHSGLGGGSIRDQERCLPTTFPYGCKQEWAKIYTTNQGATHGALFIEFNVDGDPNKAHGYFKNIDGKIIDDFTVTTAASPTPSPPSDAPRAELRGVIENVTAATARRYNATDDAGHPMEVVKILQDTTGGYLAVYHHLHTDGRFKVNLATSTNLTNWHWVRELGGSGSGGGAHQPTIFQDSNGGFVVAWEQDPSHLAFRYYASRTSLLNGTVSRSFDAPRSLSACAEGTPNIYSVKLSPNIDNSSIDVGAHYWWNCDVDRQQRGTLTNFKSWSTSAQPEFDNAVLHWGVKGNIGDRDALTYKTFRYSLVEGQYTKGDFGSWRVFLYDYQTGNADTTSIRTDRGSTAFANPSITHLKAPNGQSAIVVSLFIPSEGAASGEGGQLIYYKTY